MGSVFRQKQMAENRSAEIAREQTQYLKSSSFLVAAAQNEEWCNRKLSSGMRKSLHDLEYSLQCPLCHSVMVQPVTIVRFGKEEKRKQKKNHPQIAAWSHLHFLNQHPLFCHLFSSHLVSFVLSFSFSSTTVLCTYLLLNMY